jgi:NADH-quinone oxidoreductase subunit G
MIIIGQGALARPMARPCSPAAKLAQMHRRRSRDDWNGFNVLHTAAGALAAWISASCRAPGGKDAAHADRAVTTFCSCSAPTSSTSPT